MMLGLAEGCLGEELTAPVVAAAPGFQMLSFWFYDEEPTIEKVLHPNYRDPIVAWRLGEYGPKPIVLDDDIFIVGRPLARLQLAH